MVSSKIYLVGFGPGDPELLTLKAHRLLSETDVIFYDNLTNESFLNNYSARKIYVGKRKNRHSKNQEQINTTLLEATKTYKHIVRLKGGDPMIFGRVGEELQFLIQNGIEVDVVPGISSASASAALCKIPLTQRGISSSVAYCTGHPLKKMHIPNAETLVFFMGASTLHKIVTELIESGRDAETPIAIVYNASLHNQSTMVFTLQQILTEHIEAQSPSIIIVGNVISFINN